MFKSLLACGLAGIVAGVPVCSTFTDQIGCDAPGVCLWQPTPRTCILLTCKHLSLLGERACTSASGCKWSAQDKACFGTFTPTEDYEPCAGKRDGDSCLLCDPADKNCIENKALKTCVNGECKVETMGPYNPCEQKKENDVCSLCATFMENCTETMEVKTCQGGECKPMMSQGCVTPTGVTVAEGSSVTDGCQIYTCLRSTLLIATIDCPPIRCANSQPIKLPDACCPICDNTQTTYKPCANISDGTNCRLCDPQNPLCIETYEVKTCQNGECKSGTGHFDPCLTMNEGDICHMCGPNDVDCVETQEIKTCQSGACIASTSKECTTTTGVTLQEGESITIGCSQLTCMRDELIEAVISCPAPGSLPCDTKDQIRLQDQCCPSCKQSPKPYDPCENKMKGEGCTLCDPLDRTCVEDRQFKACDAVGKCTPTANQVCDEKAAAENVPNCPAFDCGGYYPSGCEQVTQFVVWGSLCCANPCNYVTANGVRCERLLKPIAYDPCQGQAEGARCTMCDPNGPKDCIETMVEKTCQMGVCAAGLISQCDSVTAGLNINVCPIATCLPATMYPTKCTRVTTFGIRDGSCCADTCNMEVDGVRCDPITHREGIETVPGDVPTPADYAPTPVKPPTGEASSALSLSPALCLMLSIVVSVVRT